MIEISAKAAIAYFPRKTTIGLRLTIDGEEVRRNYSLSAAPNGHEYRISVKREPNGKVSNHLHSYGRVGDQLDVFTPSGNFKLEYNERPLVLISGGVGITPTLAILEAALDTDRSVHFIHSARHGGVHAFRQKIEELSARHSQLRHFFCYERQRDEDKDLPVHSIGYLDESLLAQWLPQKRNVDAYYLGPLPFMKAVKKALKALGVPESQSRYEFFGPATALD
jgi:nitric oxide dioxygenase